VYKTDESQDGAELFIRPEYLDLLAAWKRAQTVLWLGNISLTNGTNRQNWLRRVLVRKDTGRTMLLASVLGSVPPAQGLWLYTIGSSDITFPSTYMVEVNRNYSTHTVIGSAGWRWSG
jgi:hypothetical protein